jgi:hypothetical protein
MLILHFTVGPSRILVAGAIIWILSLVARKKDSMRCCRQLWVLNDVAMAMLAGADGMRQARAAPPAAE